LETQSDVVIVGAGPAGLTAGLYASRARLSTVIIEKETFGGELVNRDMIENYPGFANGVMGPQLGSEMAQQAMNCGAQIQFGEVESVEFQADRKLVRTSAGDFAGKALIIASGSRPRKLGLPGEVQFADNGVFYCATCDGPQFAGKVVVVAGGGNSGITEALFLSRFVSRVIVVEFLPRLTATAVLRERARSDPKIEIRCGAKIEAITGGQHVEIVQILDTSSNTRTDLKAEGILVRIGILPNTAFLAGKVPLSETGQIIVDEKMETAVRGVFAIGDVRRNSPMQIASAVGDGAVAAMSLERSNLKI
jgi:thioredoxin reductase (NADPH)